jgi:serpin B
MTGTATAAMMLLAAMGCQDPTGPEGGADPITELPRTLTIGEQDLIGASNRFGFSLLGQLRDAEPAENLFYSPLSAHIALGMALTGARDSTYDAIATTLGFADGGALPPLEDINASYESLADLLLGLDPKVEIGIANSAWYQPMFPFRLEFLSTVQRVFDARVDSLDFSDPNAPDVINSWVDSATNGRIDKMIEEFDAREVLSLLNAIYFKGQWTHQFDPDDTRDALFHLPDGSTKTVRMMVRGEGTFGHRWEPDGEIIDLPYGGGAFRMTIVLPRPDLAIEDVIDGLDAARWDAWTADLPEAGVPVHLPRFTLEWEKSLNDVLKALGMEIAFVPGRADFGGMLQDGFDPQAMGTDLHITRVKQKSFVDVNEEGTEAAAATSVGVGVTSAPVPVVVDRPFLLAIRERLSGTILFLGVVLDPPSR